MIYLRRIFGNSMLPAFKPGKLVIFRRRNTYKPGDVVLLSHGGIEKIKRIKNIKASKVFVVGDNQIASTDSRNFGVLEKKLIKGRAIRIGY